jgi:RNase P subunit RPR2
MEMLMVTSNLLKAYPFGRLQDFLTLHDLLVANGKSVDDLRAYVTAKQAAMARGRKIAGAVLSRQCPGCGRRLAFYRVNTGPRDQTGDDSTFVWTCPGCGHEEWTNKPLRTIIRDLHGGRAPKPATQRTHHRGQPSRRRRRR